jgi:hypothetical protein
MLSNSTAEDVVLGEAEWAWLELFHIHLELFATLCLLFAFVKCRQPQAELITPVERQDNYSPGDRRRGRSRSASRLRSFFSAAATKPPLQRDYESLSSTGESQESADAWHGFDIALLDVEENQLDKLEENLERKFYVCRVRITENGLLSLFARLLCKREEDANDEEDANAPTMLLLSTRTPAHACKRRTRRSMDSGGRQRSRLREAEVPLLVQMTLCSTAARIRLRKRIDREILSEDRDVNHPPLEDGDGIRTLQVYEERWHELYKPPPLEWDESEMIKPTDHLEGKQINEPTDPMNDPWFTSMERIQLMRHIIEADEVEGGLRKPPGSFDLEKLVQTRALSSFMPLHNLRLTDRDEPRLRFKPKRGRLVDRWIKPGWGLFPEESPDAKRVNNPSSFWWPSSGGDPNVLEVDVRDYLGEEIVCTCLAKTHTVPWMPTHPLRSLSP